MNAVWLWFFLMSFVAGLWQWLLLDRPEVLSAMVNAAFEMAQLGAEIALGLIGVLALWLGLFRIATEAGLTAVIARLLTPLFARLLPEVPAGHPALGSVSLNLGANLLGLDNAATPLGLQAMRDLQTVNPAADTASNAQILFLVLNTSSVTLLPVTVFLYRAQQGAADPTAVFIPILLATTASTMTGLLMVAAIQRLRLWDGVVLAYFAGFAGLLAVLLTALTGLSSEALAARSTVLGNFMLLSIIMLFLAAGAWRRVPVYETFIEGAKEGFVVAVRLLPFLVAMLVAIGLLRASGVLDGALWLVAAICDRLGMNTDFVPSLTTALMKPFSGSGARAMLIETIDRYGVDSFPAQVAAVMQGSTETTFYVLAVYFGSIGVRKTRYAIACGLTADVAGIVTAIMVSYWFFH